MQPQYPRPYDSYYPMPQPPFDQQNQYPQVQQVAPTPMQPPQVPQSPQTPVSAQPSQIQPATQQPPQPNPYVTPQPMMPYGGYQMMPQQMMMPQMQMNGPTINNTSSNNNQNNNNIQINIGDQVGQRGPGGFRNEVLSCTEICCSCRTPHFAACHKFFGLLTSISCGSCLSTGALCCCYGCDRPSCCSVYCAGCGMVITTPCIFGIVSSCMVGCSMLGSQSIM